MNIIFDEEVEYSKSELEEIIGEIVKLNPLKRKENRNRKQNLNPKQTINQATNIFSKNKRWKPVIQTKKLNQSNTLSFVSTQWNHQKSLQQFNQAIIIIGDKKFVTTTEPKAFTFDLREDAAINLKHEIKLLENIMKFLLSIQYKKRLDNHYSNIGMETIFMNTENS